MGIIKLFVQSRCPKCPQAKQVGNALKEEGFKVLEYDLETADGLAEASFYGVQSTPTFILEDQDRRWSCGLCTSINLLRSPDEKKEKITNDKYLYVYCQRCP